MKFITEKAYGKNAKEAFASIKDKYPTVKKYFYLKQNEFAMIPIDVIRFILFSRPKDRPLTTTEKKYKLLAEDLFGPDFFKYSCYCYKNKLSYSFVF